VWYCDFHLGKKSVHSFSHASKEAFTHPLFGNALVILNHGGP